MYKFKFLIKMSWSSGEKYSRLSDDSDARLLQSFGQLKPRPSKIHRKCPAHISKWTKSLWYMFCFL